MEECGIPLSVLESSWSWEYFHEHGEYSSIQSSLFPDIDVETMEVYRRIRNSLGIQELVREHRITYNQDLGIESNTEAVIAFWTVFCKKWDVAEHEWFLNECRRQLVGEKVVILRFNNEGYLDRPSVKDYYDRISEQPLIDDPNFRVVRLA